MEDGNISEEELAKLLEGMDGEEFFGSEMQADITDSSAQPPQPASSGGSDRVLSQAEIDALLASFNADND